MFYTNDRKLAREEIAVPLETGMLLLHKHGDDCLLVRLPLSTFSLSPSNSFPPANTMREAALKADYLTLI